MAKHVKLERPREGVALVTMSNPAINNHGSWIGIGELAAAMKGAREAGARVTMLADRPAKAIATLKRILLDNDDMNLTDALANEQPCSRA